MGSARDRGASRPVVAGPARHHPDNAAAPQRARLPEGLDARRIAAAGRVARARRCARSPPAGEARRPDPRRARDELRQPFDHGRARAPAPRKRAAIAGAADVPAILLHDHGLDLRAGDRGTRAVALDPGTAHGQPVLGGRRLHRGARGQRLDALAEARSQAPALLVPLDPEALLHGWRPVSLLLPRDGAAGRHAARPRRQATGRSASSPASVARNG